MTDEEFKKQLAAVGPLDYLNLGRLLCRLHEASSEQLREPIRAEIADEERLLEADIAQGNGRAHPIRDLLVQCRLSLEDQELALRVVCVAGHLQITTPRLPTVSQIAHAANHIKGLLGFVECRKVVVMLCEKNVFMVGSSPASPTDHYIGLHKSIIDYLTGSPAINMPSPDGSPRSPTPKGRLQGAGSSARKLYELARKRVIGLDPLVRAACTRVIMHRDRGLLLQSGANPNLTGANQVLLLLGPSGSGKTFLLQSVAEVAGFPFSLFDATALTEEGFVGLSASDAVASLIAAAGKDEAVARYGILCLDEWDSRAVKQAGTRDIAGAVQKAVLRLIEGCSFPVGGRRSGMDRPTTFDSRGTMFAFAGAFAGLAEILQRRSRQKSGLGFAGAAGETLTPESDLYEGLLEYGCAPEFLNRVTRVLVFPRPTLEQLIAIATSLHGPIAKVNAGLSNRLSLDFDEAAVRLMAAHAFETKRYARGITSLVQTIAEDLVFSGARGRQVVLAEEVRDVIAAMRDGAAGLMA
jgi:ATP-dependent Clp protease ATP-binding subunit ClpX